MNLLYPFYRKSRSHAVFFVYCFINEAAETPHTYYKSEAEGEILRLLLLSHKELIPMKPHYITRGIQTTIPPWLQTLSVVHARQHGSARAGLLANLPIIL